MKSQPAHAMTIGTGYSQIRNGRTIAGSRRRSRTTPPICPRNWTTMRVAMSASMTTSNEKKLLTMEMAPSTSSDT